MKYNIVKNDQRNTLTVILSPININYAKYLYSKYKGEKFFASGIVRGADYSKDLVPFIKDLTDKLNLIGKDTLPSGIRFTQEDVITLKDDEYKLFTRNLDKEGNWDKQFKVNLTNRSKDENKKFMFLDLQQTQPISETDSWKHNYAVELEIGVGYDENKMNKYVFAIFHRAISMGMKEQTGFTKNDNAWTGFNLETPTANASANLSDIELKDEDLPF
jgi:hypothetical protein